MTGSSIVLRVTCLSDTNCLAAGYDFPTKLAVPVVRQWHGIGHGWAETKLPNPAGTSNELYSISCASPTDCVVVGQRQAPPPSHKATTLIEHLAGTTWHLLSSPSVGIASGFEGVECGTPCIAVGYVSDGMHFQAGLAVRRT
jgi:hypothetical protein